MCCIKVGQSGRAVAIPSSNLLLNPLTRRAWWSPLYGAKVKVTYDKRQFLSKLLYVYELKCYVEVLPMATALLFKLQMAMHCSGTSASTECNHFNATTYCITSCPAQWPHRKLATFETKVERPKSSQRIIHSTHTIIDWLFWPFSSRLSGFISKCHFLVEVGKEN